MKRPALRVPAIDDRTSDALALRSPDGDAIALSISVGFAPYRAGWSLDNALAQADAAMCGATRGARNQMQAAA